MVDSGDWCEGDYAHAKCAIRDKVGGRWTTGLLNFKYTHQFRLLKASSGLCGLERVIVNTPGW